MTRYEIWVDNEPQMYGELDKLERMLERLNTPRARLVLVERAESVRIVELFEMAREVVYG